MSELTNMVTVPNKTKVQMWLNINLPRKASKAAAEKKVSEYIRHA